MDKRKIVRYLLITLSVILGVLVFLSITGTVAHAAGLVDNTVSDANTYSKYPLENYQLDFYVDSSWDWLPWNWLDGIGKAVTSTQWYSPITMAAASLITFPVMGKSTPLSWRSVSQRTSPAVSKSPIRMRLP